MGTLASARFCRRRWIDLGREKPIFRADYQALVLFPARRQSGSAKRVVITGAGLVTALGLCKAENEEGFRRGRVAFQPIELFDVSRQRAKLAALVNLPATVPTNRLRRQEVSRMDRAGRILFLAAQEAWRESGWESSTRRLPLVLGTTGGGMSLGEEYYRQAVSQPRRRREQPRRALHYQPQRQALNLMEAFGLEGSISIIANACASGGNAIGHAWELVRNGIAERVLAGGYEALDQLVFAGFDSLQALSTTAPRPFDANRDGLGLGEGAAVLCLETWDSAQARGAGILGELAGYGAGTDTHHLTQPHPEGKAAVAAMQEACRQAEIGPKHIGYLNAHGTGTSLNDHAEAKAINQWAGPAAAGIFVSSTKGGIGHLLGAAGAVEAVVCLLALKGQWLPPGCGIQTPEPECAFRLVREPIDYRFEYAMSNSFGFGGANATLIFRRWH